MELEFSFQDVRKTLAIYFHNHRTTKVYLTKIWKENDYELGPTATDDKRVANFIRNLSRIMAHEAIHEAVQDELQASGLKLDMWHTANEWIAKRLNSEPIKGWSLVNYAIRDVANARKKVHVKSEHKACLRLRELSRKYRICIHIRAAAGLVMYLTYFPY